MILPAGDGFAVYNLRTDTATHYLTHNYSTLDTKCETTMDAVKQFESFRETLKNEKCSECGGHLYSGYLLHTGSCSHLKDKQEPR